MVRRGDLAELSRERVTDEIKKLLAATRPSVGLALAGATGAIAASFPELEAAGRDPAGSGVAPEGDVWVHTLMVVDETSAVAHRGTGDSTVKSPCTSCSAHCSMISVRPRPQDARGRTADPASSPHVTRLPARDPRAPCSHA